MPRQDAWAAAVVWGASRKRRSVTPRLPRSNRCLGQPGQAAPAGAQASALKPLSPLRLRRAVALARADRRPCRRAWHRGTAVALRPRRRFRECDGQRHHRRVARRGRYLGRTQALSLRRRQNTPGRPAGGAVPVGRDAFRGRRCRQEPRLGCGRFGVGQPLGLSATTPGRLPSPVLRISTEPAFLHHAKANFVRLQAAWDAAVSDRHSVIRHAGDVRGTRARPCRARRRA